MKTIKNSVLVCLILLSSFSLWAEGSKEEESKTKDEPKILSIVSQPTTVTEGLKAVLKEAEARLGIKAEVEVVPGSSEGVNVIRSRIATNDMPDIFLFNSGALMYTLDPESNFVDLSNEPFMSKLDESYKKTVSVDGKVYGVPTRPANYGGWIYNKKIYEELGLKVPKTWDELIANSEKIKAAGKTAVIGSFKSTWTSQLIILADFYNVQTLAPNFTEDYTANKANYSNTPAALRSFQKLAEVYEKGLMNKDFMATTYDDAQRMIVEGIGVQWPMLSQALPVIAKNYPDKVNDLSMFPQPSDDPNINGFTVWMPNSFYVTKSCKDLDSTKKLLSFYISDEGLKIFAINQALDGSFLVKNAPLPEKVITAVTDIMPYANKGKVAPALEFLSLVKGPNLMQICVEVGSGIVSPEKGAYEADNDAAEQARQLGLSGW